jgi:hypothetical protein
MTRHDQVSRGEATSRAEEAPQHGGRGCERGIGNDAKRPSREPEVGGVGLDDDHTGLAKAIAQVLGTSRMQLDRDDACASRDEPCCDRSRPRADVDDEIPVANLGTGDESFSPPVGESMPAPPRRRSPGHGAPSP